MNHSYECKNIFIALILNVADSKYRNLFQVGYFSKKNYYLVLFEN